MPNFSVRSNQLEIMDDLNCAGNVLDQTLHELEIINAWLGGNAITLDALNTLIHNHPDMQELVIADLGCGSGDMLRIIYKWGQKKNIRLKLIGIDANPAVIAFAQKNLYAYPQIELKVMDIFSSGFRQTSYDIVVGTLFYHHFTDQELSIFFQRLKHQVRIGFIINDIHRHWLAYYSIQFLTRMFSKSAMVKFDAPLSVLRAFKKKELKSVLQKAEINNYTAKWKWAFRWQVIVTTLNSLKTTA